MTGIKLMDPGAVVPHFPALTLKTKKKGTVNKVWEHSQKESNYYNSVSLCSY